MSQVSVKVPPNRISSSMPGNKHEELPNLLVQASSGVGLFISLGEAFISRGIGEMDNIILPKLHGLLSGSVIPRVLPSYDLLMWFILEVHD